MKTTRTETEPKPRPKCATCGGELAVEEGTGVAYHVPYGGAYAATVKRARAHAPRIARL